VPLSNTFNTPTDQSTYSMDTDCTGTLTLVLDDGSSRVYQLAAVQGGAEIEFAETSASIAVVSAGDAKKQPPTCDATTSLTGHLAGITGGKTSFSSTLFGGTYSVSSNCIGTATFRDSGGQRRSLQWPLGAQIVGEGVGKKQ
jgi:hypothetical protein